MPLVEQTQYGFRWGPAEVLRVTCFRQGVVLAIRTVRDGRVLRQMDVYVSRGGRTIKVLAREGR